MLFEPFFCEHNIFICNTQLFDCNLFQQYNSFTPLICMLNLWRSSIQKRSTHTFRLVFWSLLPTPLEISSGLQRVGLLVFYFTLASTARKFWIAFMTIHGIISFTTYYKTKAPLPFIKPILPLVVMRICDLLMNFTAIASPLFLDGYDAFAPWVLPVFALSGTPTFFLMDSHPEVIGSTTTTSEKKKFWEEIDYF